MLFNVLNSTAMGMGPMAAGSGEQMMICSSMAHGAAAVGGHHHHDPAQHHSGCCCCLSMCCTGATLPDGDMLAQLAPSDWSHLTFSITHDSQRHPAPSLGGTARAPPQAA